MDIVHVDAEKKSVVKGFGSGSEVQDLPVTIGSDFVDQRSALVRVSRWRPTEAERRLIAEGGDVYLWVFGSEHPPVRVTANRPVPVEGSWDPQTPGSIPRLMMAID